MLISLRYICYYHWFCYTDSRKILSAHLGPRSPLRPWGHREHIILLTPTTMPPQPGMFALHYSSTHKSRTSNYDSQLASQDTNSSYHMNMASSSTGRSLPGGTANSTTWYFMGRVLILLRKDIRTMISKEIENQGSLQVGLLRSLVNEETSTCLRISSSHHSPCILAATTLRASRCSKVHPFSYQTGHKHTSFT